MAQEHLVWQRLYDVAKIFECLQYIFFFVLSISVITDSLPYVILVCEQKNWGLTGREIRTFDIPLDVISFRNRVEPGGERSLGQNLMFRKRCGNLLRK
jgi:hypothetical protein